MCIHARIGGGLLQAFNISGGPDSIIIMVEKLYGGYSEILEDNPLRAFCFWYNDVVYTHVL